MTSELDLDALLAPIAVDAPTGIDPRQNFDPVSLYFRLRDTRAQARAAERQADSSGADEEAPAAQWTPVLRLGVQLLTEEAKDLEVASWCAEALLRLDGLPGLTAGCTLMEGLVETFWDELHPMPEENGMRDRVAPISGLNGEGGEGTLIQPLRKLVLFRRPDGTALPLWQFQQSMEVAGIGDAAKRAQRLAGGVIAFEQIETDAVTAGVSVFADLGRDAAAAARAWRSLSASLDEYAGSDAPPTSRVRDLLDEIASIAARFAPPPPEKQDGATVPGTQAQSEAPVGGSAGPRTITSRDDALRILDEVAGYFKRTEPHSPLAYTLYEAVRRGRLGWPELLEEVVPDTDLRDAILRNLGIRPSSPPE